MASIVIMNKKYARNGFWFTKCMPKLGRVATAREKVLENEKFSRSGKSQRITFLVREILKKMKKVMEKSENLKIFLKRC